MHILSAVYNILSEIYNILSELYNILSDVYNILSEMYNILYKIYPILSEIYNIFSKVYNILSEVYNILSDVYNILYEIYHILSEIYNILSKVYNILSEVYNILSDVHVYNILSEIYNILYITFCMKYKICCITILESTFGGFTYYWNTANVCILRRYRYVASAPSKWTGSTAYFNWPNQHSCGRERMQKNHCKIHVIVSTREVLCCTLTCKVYWILTTSDDIAWLS